jgi:hypothetical protein
LPQTLPTAERQGNSQYFLEIAEKSADRFTALLGLPHGQTGAETKARREEQKAKDKKRLIASNRCECSEISRHLERVDSGSFQKQRERHHTQLPLKLIPASLEDPQQTSGRANCYL